MITPTFSRTVKRLHRNQKDDLDKAVQILVANTQLGESKVGDLTGIMVFKFRMVNQVRLIAYTLIDNEILKLLALGTHENFNRDHKS